MVLKMKSIAKTFHVERKFAMDFIFLRFYYNFCNALQK